MLLINRKSEFLLWKCHCLTPTIHIKGLSVISSGDGGAGSCFCTQTGNFGRNLTIKRNERSVKQTKLFTNNVQKKKRTEENCTWLHTQSITLTSISIILRSRFGWVAFFYPYTLVLQRSHYIAADVFKVYNTHTLKSTGGQGALHAPHVMAQSILIIRLMATIRQCCQCINLVTEVFYDSLSSAKSHNTRITFPYQEQWYINCVITFTHMQTQPHILPLE